MSYRTEARAWQTELGTIMITMFLPSYRIEIMLTDLIRFKRAWFVSLLFYFLSSSHAWAADDPLWRTVSQEESDKIVQVINEVVQQQDIALFDQLRNEVDDPYLFVIKSSLLIKSSQMEEAKLEMEKAVAAMPKNLHVRMSSISLKLQEKDFAGSLKDLDSFDSDFPNWIGKYFRYTDGYEVFQASDEGKAWSSKRRADRQK